MRVPIQIKFTRKCPRCGLRYPRKAPQCTHCSNLSDQQVKVLQQRYASYRAGDASLGRFFFYLAAVLIVIMVIASLRGT